MRILTIFGVIILFAYCKGKPAPVAQKENPDTTKYFQVVQFIQKEIDEVNRTPYFIYRLNITGIKKDSTAINNEGFNELARQFMHPDINDPSIKKYYSESVFYDETTKSFNLSYTTTNKDLEIQNVDVLLKEDGETVKRIFIRKFFNYNDSSATEQLIWKPNERFQVIRLLQTSEGNNETSRQNIVVWNEKG